MNKENFRSKQKYILKNQTKRFKKDFLVFQEIFKIIKKNKVKNILLYIPLKYEINLYKFRNKLNKNHNLFVPFMQDKSLKIVKLRLPFYKKRFDILEPRNSLLKAKIDLAIIPTIGIDKDFKRIGHGNGFYDRFFANLSYKPMIIFIQNTNSISLNKITNSYDIEGDFYINPYKKYFKKENKNDNTRISNYKWYNLRWNNRIFSCQKNKRG